MRRGLGRTILIGVFVAAAAAFALIFLVRATVPADAFSAPVARTALTGQISPDVLPGDDPIIPPNSPVGQECLPRIERESGWADLCWAAYRLAEDSDPEKDYYYLRMYGSFQSTGVLGIRWLSIEAKLDGEPGGSLYDGWPDGTFDGPCHTQEAHLLVPLGPASTEEICGTTTGHFAMEPWGWQTSWTCAPCRPFDTQTRAIGMVNVIGMPEGVIPAWDLYANFGR